MAIQIYSNGRLIDLYAFGPRGKFLIVGGPNGTKLIQPGTQGLVVQDKLLSSIQPKTAHSGYMTFWESTPTNGYLAVERYNQSILKQNPSQDLMGFDSLILSADQYSTWFFPRGINRTDDAGIVMDRWGAKPILQNNVSYLNGAQSSNLDRWLLISQRVYKFEAYVMVSVTTPSSVGEITNYVKDVYIPLSETSNWQKLKLEVLRYGNIPSSGSNRIAFILFGIESSVNRENPMVVSYPVIRMNYGGSMMEDLYQVETIFCFKDN